MRPRPVILQELSGEDREPWLVGTHGWAYPDGSKWRQRVVIVEGWYETEDQARAAAHRIQYP